METRVSPVTGQMLPPTLAATHMALPHGCSVWRGGGWNDTLQPRVQLRLTGWQWTNRLCASQSLTITRYRLGLIVYDIAAVKIFDRYRNIALSIRALLLCCWFLHTCQFTLLDDRITRFWTTCSMFLCNSVPTLSQNYDLCCEFTVILWNNYIVHYAGLLHTNVKELLSPSL